MQKKITGNLLSFFALAVIVLSFVGTVLAGTQEEYSGYPLRFDGEGVVYSIALDKNNIVINDRSFQLSADTKYNRPKTLNCSGQWFKKNDYVYYLLEPGTRKIKSLWLVKQRKI